MDENEMLRESVTRYEAGQSSGGGAGAAAAAAPPQAEPAARPGELASLRSKVKDMSSKLKGAQKERERLESDKLAIFSEMNEAVQKVRRASRARRCRSPPNAGLLMCRC